MENAVRDLFKSERLRLGLNQTQVARRAGSVGQGTISQIEIDPKYQPSVAVFKNALNGIGHTLSSFFAQIEGLPNSARIDDGLPPIVPADQVAETVIQTLAGLLARATERADEAHHRQVADPRAAAAERAAPRRVRARRPAQRRSARKRKR